MKPFPPEDQHPLESVSSMRRRRFLGLAAFAGTSVIGVGVTGAAAAAASPDSTDPAAAAPEPQQLHTIDKDTGWPIFSGAQPPKGYERHHLPCDPAQYVDVPVAAAAEAHSNPYTGVTVLHPPYRHEDWHRVSGGHS
jgi:hypothetical protein